MTAHAGFLTTNRWVKRILGLRRKMLRQPCIIAAGFARCNNIGGNTRHRRRLVIKKVNKLSETFVTLEEIAQVIGAFVWHNRVFDMEWRR